MFDDCQLDSDADQYDVLYVAVAFLTHSMMNMLCSDDSPGVWWQELATYSPTLAGLKKAMVFYWEHKLSTPELYGLSQQEMREEMKIALYQVKLPKGTVDLGRVQDGSYTWATGEAYLQIERHTRLISQALKLESLRHQREELQSKSDKPDFELSWEREQLDHVETQLQKYLATDIGGYISWSGVFDPPSDEDLPSKVMALRKEQSPDVKAESGIACLACSL